jgi:exosortase/archaeosortase family protein
MSQCMSWPGPTVTVRGRPNAAEFAVRGAAWSLAFFALLRAGWMESYVVLPATHLQAALATALIGAPTMRVDVTLACSGADALALCLGTVLAYPIRWRTRAWGAAGGIAVVLGLNTLRIGTLGRAPSPEWFDALHLYIWPAILMLAIAGYVFAWMSVSDRRQDAIDISAARRNVPWMRPHPSRRFVALTIIFLLLFAAGSPFLLTNPHILALGGIIASATAGLLNAVDVRAHATSNMLWTPRGTFLVTQECISTPLIPLYLAFVCAYSPSLRRLIVGLIATLPLFTALGIARLLVVALPAAIVSSPLFFVHAFYQLVLGAVIVVGAAVWRHGGTAAPRHALVGVLTAALFAVVLDPWYARALVYQPGPPLDDPQGAIALLPVFQIALYVGLWVAAFVAVGWSRFFIGLAALTVTQAAGLLVLQALANQSGFAIHVRDIRGWAVAGPVLIFAAVVSSARPRR